MKYLQLYLLIVNAVAFVLMLTDKLKAQKSKRRIPESTLLTFAALGGSIGTLMGMYIFRHKTLHNKFTMGVPAILLLQVLAAAAMYWLYY